MICASTPKYMPLLIKEDVVTNNNKKIICYNLEFSRDDTILNDWALHIRRHYISDKELQESCLELGLTKEQYLKKFCIPQDYEVLGAQCMSGDFAEIVISDIFEFLYSYRVPRVKMENRSGKNNSEHGTDVIALKCESQPSHEDELIVSEVKSNLSNSSDYSVLDKAIKDSQSNDIDNHRFAHTLDFLRKKCKEKQEFDLAKMIARFQVKTEKPYKTIFIPAGINSVASITSNIVIENDKYLTSNRRLIYIHGEKLFELLKDLYWRICRL